MTDYRKNLLDRMTALYGFENPIVIQFAQLCETFAETSWNNKSLRILVEAHEADPCYDFDEED